MKGQWIALGFCLMAGVWSGFPMPLAADRLLMMFCLAASVVLMARGWKSLKGRQG